MITGIGISGRMKAGKDTMANMFKNKIMRWKGANYNVVHTAFAEPLKDIAMQYLGLTKHQCYDQEGKAEFNNFWGMTNREILQRIGTDAMRNGFHPDVWVKIAELKLQRIIDDGDFFIVSDIRFENEADLVKRLGGIVVNIERDTCTNSTHASEQELPKNVIDYDVINNGTLDDLQSCADRIINLERNKDRLHGDIELDFSTEFVYTQQ